MKHTHTHTQLNTIISIQCIHYNTLLIVLILIGISLLCSLLCSL